MVLEYYNLREQPFGVTPDFRYLVCKRDTPGSARLSPLWIGGGPWVCSADREARDGEDDVALPGVESAKR